MTRNTTFKAASLAAAIALAMGSTAVMAQSAPTATQLPGMGHAVVGIADAAPIDTTTPSAPSQNIAITGNTVINWGVGAAGDINAKQPGGFNIGSGAALTFTGDPVLNVDRSGNMSQIMGDLTGTTLYVANANGIIVGNGAKVTATAALGLIANVTGDAQTFNAGGTVAYQGTGGGDLTVMSGAKLSGTTILLSGGNNVNVDVSALVSGTTVKAGRTVGGAFGEVDNAIASINITGDSATATGGTLDSAGDITNAGKVTFGSTVTADGMFTNNGELDASTAVLSAANVTNEGTLTTAAGSFKSLVNDGSYTATGGITTTGELTNSGDIVANGDVSVTGGRLTNNGEFTVGTVDADGKVTADHVVTADSVNNHGTMNGVSSITTTGSDDGSSYSINNDGTISAMDSLAIDANTNAGAGAEDGTTGNFTNSGILNVGAKGALTVDAANVASLAGSVNAASKANSATNPVGAVTLTAGDLINSAADLSSAAAVEMTASRIELFNNVTTTGAITLAPGDKSDSGYALRVAKGTTTSAGGALTVVGSGDSNIILQGMLSGDSVILGSNTAPVSDVFSGPEGGIAVTGGSDTANATAEIHFTGAVKTAKYLNDANNFRYNYLPISSDNPLTLTLDPVKYDTNGTSNGLSSVNVLVNNDVTLADVVIAANAGAPSAGESAVTGVNDTPNTHLVLQSTGSINTTGAFYWPGLVYLGTISADSKGNAMPGTLGFGTITTGGEFNNVLPGNVNYGGGIHFITQLPLSLNGNVITNANSYVNFGTDTLTNGYKNGSLKGDFFGGQTGAGKVVNYDKLDASNFHTAPPVASR